MTAKTRRATRGRIGASATAVVVSLSLLGFSGAAAAASSVSTPSPTPSPDAVTSPLVEEPVVGIDVEGEGTDEGESSNPSDGTMSGTQSNGGAGAGDVDGEQNSGTEAPSNGDLGTTGSPGAGAVDSENVESLSLTADEGVMPYADSALGCSYANPNTGAYSSTLCWLNMEGVSTEYVFDEVTGSVEKDTSLWGRTRYRTTASGTYTSVLGEAYGKKTATNVQGDWTAWGGTQEQARELAVAAARASAGVWSPTAGEATTGYGPITGYPVEVALSASYKLTANITISGAEGALAVGSKGFPTWGRADDCGPNGSFLGRCNFYTGVDGEPALYHAQDAGGKSSTVKLDDIKVVGSDNEQVSGFSIVVADAESTDNGESIAWSYTNSSGFLWLPNYPDQWYNTAATTPANTARKTAGVGNAYSGTDVSNWPAYSNTTAHQTGTLKVSANGQQVSPKTGTGMLQISPSNTTGKFSVTQVMKGNGKQGVAFGVMLASARVNVKVADRILDTTGVPSTTDFKASLTAAGYGAATTATGTTETQKQGDDQVYPLGAAGQLALTFGEVTSSADPLLASYTKSWSCFKSEAGSSTLVPWNGNGGSTPPSSTDWAKISANQFIECTLTYTPPYLTLVKSVDPDGTKAADQPSQWNLTATGRASASLAKSDGAEKKRMAVATGTYDLTEDGPSSKTWEPGYRWTGLACKTSDGVSVPADSLRVTKDTDGVVTEADLSVATGNDVTCTYTNTANEPKLAISKTSSPASGKTIASGETVTYTLTFDNSAGTGAINVNHTDHLRDVLDDATYVDKSIRYTTKTGSVSTTNGAPPGFSATPGTGDHSPNQPACTADDCDPWANWDPRLNITGPVPARTTVTVSFEVKVKDNEVDRNLRSDQPAPYAQYHLQNYLTEAGATPPASCVPPTDGVSPTCTEHPIRAWTIDKDSQPMDGAAIYSGGNIYYRVKVENFSGEALKGIELQDDLTQTLAASVLDFSAPNAVTVPWGISFYDANGAHISGDDITWSWNSADSTVTGETAPTIAFVGKDDDACNLAHKFGTDDFPAAAAGCWTMTTTFDMPAKIDEVEVAYAIVGYAVRGGRGAAANHPTTPGSETVASQATWVNTVQAPKAMFGDDSTGTAPNFCSSDSNSGAGIPPGWANTPEFFSNYASCKTYHTLQESYFHIWKKDASTSTGPGANNNLTGATFVLADTEAQARSAQPSRWLCRANNNPWDSNSNPPSEIAKRPADQVYQPPGSDPSASGAGDFGKNSATHAAIVAWNAAYPDDEKELCGLFYYLETEDAGQAAGSWRAQDVRGGDTVDNNDPASAPKQDWRTDSALNVTGDDNSGRHGTYWLVETKSPENHQLLSQPMKMWVAPSSPATNNISPQTQVWYDYQGRLSLPVVGLGESDTELAVMPSGNITAADSTPIRPSCVNPWVLPANNQPNCVMPTGWTMPVFDVKLQGLPLTGGDTPTSLFLAAGLVALGIGAGGAIIWRRRSTAQGGTEADAI